MAVINTYTIDLDEQLKASVEQAEIYQNLQAKTKENPTERLSMYQNNVYYIKTECMYLMYLKLSY